MRLIVATKNKGKLREIRDILKGLDLSIVSLADLDKKIRIVENGKTFLENSLKKAIPVSNAYAKDYVLGEDSGLEVDCLEAAPGIYSKRYAGQGATDAKNNKKLLNALKNTASRKRGARYRCCLVLARGGRLLKAFDGSLEGSVSRAPRGSRGFGYDPVFYLSAYKKTVAQLPISLKNRISHRAKAFKKLKRFLKISL